MLKLKLPIGKIRAIRKDPEIGRIPDVKLAHKHGVGQHHVLKIRDYYGIPSSAARAAMERAADVGEICSAHDDGVIDLVKHNVHDVNRIMDKSYSGSIVKEARRHCGVTFKHLEGTSKPKPQEPSEVSVLLHGWGR